MHVLIGIDDTDNKDSRGTGYKARKLGRLIEDMNIGKVIGITRHQLYVHDDIAYTSQNSSACLDILSEKRKELELFCASYINQEAEEGSDAGLCVVEFKNISKEIQEWGRRAKKEVLTLAEAIELATTNKVYLKGFTGTRIGQIGALAAVGLRKCGNDGRFIWLRGPRELRDLNPGVYEINRLKQITRIENFISKNGLPIEENCRILCGEWIRPLLKRDKPTLVLDKVTNADYDWKTASKDYIRSNS